MTQRIFPPVACLCAILLAASSFSAAEAPADLTIPRPTDAVTLFNGSDTSHWTHGSSDKIKWTVADGALRIVPKSGNLMTKKSFRDFQLHLEFKIPLNPTASGNSGIYIQKRYEVQILNSHGKAKPSAGDCGGLYKVKAPDTNATRPPGQWQSYDIFFRAARYDADGKKTENVRITVVHNGKLIHDNVELTQKTGAGDPEGPKPGPILLQDHGAAIEFKNIWIAPRDYTTTGLPNVKPK